MFSTETSRLNEAQTSSEYLIFSGVQYQTWLGDFIHSDDILSAKAYSDYLHWSQILIVNMETAAHAQGHGLLHTMIMIQAETMSLLGETGRNFGQDLPFRLWQRKEGR